MPASYNGTAVAHQADIPAQPQRVYVQFMWTGPVAGAFPGVSINGTHAIVQADRTQAVEGHSNTSCEAEHTTARVAGRLITVRTENKKEILLDRGVILFAKWAGLSAHMLKYFDLLADKFQIKDSIRCRPFRDPETGEARLRIEFTTIGDVDDIAEREFSFRRKLIKSIPREKRRRFFLAYHIG